MQIVKDEMWDRLVGLDLIWYEEWVLWGRVSLTLGCLLCFLDDVTYGSDNRTSIWPFGQSLSGKLIDIDEWQSAQQAVNTIALVALGQSRKPQIAKTIKPENQKYKNRKIFNYCQQLEEPQLIYYDSLRKNIKRLIAGEQKKEMAKDIKILKRRFQQNSLIN